MEETYASCLGFFKKIETCSDFLELSNQFQDLLLKIETYESNQQHDLIKAIINSLNNTQSESIANLFLDIIFQIFLKLLLQDVQKRLDLLLTAISATLRTNFNLAFVSKFSSLVQGIFTDKYQIDQIDLNFFLAIQAPIFAHVVAKNEGYGQIFEMWFGGLAYSKGYDIFKTNYQLALSYFKLMNHAFFQASVANTEATLQDQFLVDAQKLMRTAIASISSILYQQTI